MNAKILNYIKSIDWSKAVRVVFPFVCMFLVFEMVVQPGTVRSCSMEPTLKEGSLTLGVHLFDRENLLQGDIIIFRFDEKRLIKRVVGTPGDVVSFRDGAVYVNGSMMEEEYLPAGTVTEPEKENSYTVPEGCYFVMGDNRGNSNDSRFWQDPYVESEDILTKCVFYCNPLLGGRVVRLVDAVRYKVSAAFDAAKYCGYSYCVRLADFFRNI